MTTTRKRRGGSHAHNGHEEKVCCIEGCVRPVTRRGLCQSCYQLLWRDVHKGKTTWSQLEKQGLAKPLRSESTPLRRAQAKAKSKAKRCRCGKKSVVECAGRTGG